MKMKMRERNRMKEKPSFRDLQKPLKEGRRDCCSQGKLEGEVKVYEDGMKELKQRETKWRK